MITSFLLFPMGNTHAWSPGCCSPSSGSANGRGGWPALAAAGGLQMLGGHPETPVFTALLAAVYLLARGSARPLAAWGRFVAGWGVAAAISAIQLLPLFLTLTGDGEVAALGGAHALPAGTVAAVLLRLILPDLFGHPAAGHLVGAVQLRRHGDLRRRADPPARRRRPRRRARATGAGGRWP